MSMLFDFFNIAAELKKVPRKGWVEKTDVKIPESVADHSYNLAIMTMVLSDLNEYDTEKTLKMALLHDLSESITGDLTPDQISKKDKKSIENDAMDEILSHLPTKIAREYTSIWEEFKKQDSREAILVHDLDRLEMALQARKYCLEGHSENKLKVFFDSARNEIKNNEILKLLDEISYK